MARAGSRERNESAIVEDPKEFAAKFQADDRSLARIGETKRPAVGTDGGFVPEHFQRGIFNRHTAGLVREELERDFGDGFGDELDGALHPRRDSVRLVDLLRTGTGILCEVKRPVGRARDWFPVESGECVHFAQHEEEENGKNCIQLPCQIRLSLYGFNFLRARYLSRLAMAIRSAQPEHSPPSVTDSHLPQRTQSPARIRLDLNARCRSSLISRTFLSCGMNQTRTFQSSRGPSITQPSCKIVSGRRRDGRGDRLR